MNKKIILDNSNNCVGYRDEIKPFEYGVYVENINDFKKTIEVVNKIQKTNKLGQKLYTFVLGDKEFIIKENDINGRNVVPIYETITSSEIIYFNENVMKFTLNDVLEFKKNLLISNSDYKNCELFECDFEKIIDDKYENKVNVGFKYFEIQNKGKAKIIKIKLKEKVKEVKLNFENNIPLNIKYCFDGDSFKLLLNSDVIKSSDEFDELYLILINDSDTSLEIDSFNILY